MTGINETVIIGAGVSGLTTAICLAEAGMRVAILAERPPLQTTSACAGASWGPYLASDARILRWSGVSLTGFKEIAAAHPESGVHLADGIEAADFPLDVPDWARTVDHFQPCAKWELPVGYVNGWRYRIPLIDMPRYLGYLEHRASEAGVEIEIGTVHSLLDVADRARVVINCTGLGAQALLDDKELQPSRGQIVVAMNPGVTEFFQDWSESSDPTYIYPHGDRVVLGGSTHLEALDVTPSEQVTEEIIERCTRIEPRLAGVEIVGARVGIRPLRSKVRLEMERVDGTTIIHNYGHGGSGVTLSWGCARDATELARTALAA